MHHLLELYYIKCTALNVEKKIPSGPVFVVAVGKSNRQCHRLILHRQVNKCAQVETPKQQPIQFISCIEEGQGQGG